MTNFRVSSDGVCRDGSASGRNLARTPNHGRPATALSWLAAGLLLSSCAHMEAPPGGPADARRPYVAAVLPAPDSANVGRELRAEIVFSEWVDADAERGKIYLNPPLTKRLRTKLSGDRLAVTSTGLLDSNTTYVLGILGSIKDLHGLPLESPLQLAFGTGPRLDSGKLAGRQAAFQGKSSAGTFAALYPRGAELRARFQHLTHRNDSVVVPPPQPDPFKERPAYIAPTDSLGRFEVKRMRPGRYGVLGFQDINGDLAPNVGSEALAIGPSVDIVAGPTGGNPAQDFQSLTLFQYDTVPVRLVEARWAGEGWKDGKRGLATGTVRLKFTRFPHPTQFLRRESYVIRKLGPMQARDSGAVVPIQDVGLDPATGEIELATPPLEADSQYTAAYRDLRDLYGNLADTARNRAAFKVGRDADTAKPMMVFLGPRRVSGDTPKLPLDGLIPARGLYAHYNRLLSDSTLAWLRAHLIVKLDTTPVAFTLARQSAHGFDLGFAPGIPLKGQRLSVALKADTSSKAAAPASPAGAPKASSSGKDSAAGPAAKPAAAQSLPVAAFSLADAAKLGSLKFRQLPSAFGSRLVIRGLTSPMEYSRITPTSPEFTVDSLPEGFYAVDYFRDSNGDGVWHPGSLAPWAVQEPYVQWADSVEVKAGGVSRGDGDRRPNPASGPAGSAIPSTPGPSAGSPGAAVPAEKPGSQAAPAQVSATERRLSWPPDR
ncbi:MAG: Ig-like domain-containing protein [Fibrobacteria bacterium]